MIAGRSILLLFLAISSLYAAGSEPNKANKKPATEPTPTATASTTKFEINVGNAKFAVFDRESTEPKAYDSVKAGEKLTKDFKADTQHKLQLKFDVLQRGGADSPITVHQAFVALVNAKSQREVIYVAEPDKTTNSYTFELDMKQHVKDFSGLSGPYAVRLILGDSLVKNPLDWHLADVSIQVAEVEPPTIPKSKRINYEKLPEIKHQFREQDPRPPGVLSDAFGLLCAFPMLVLFGLWLRVGINFGNAKISLWALGFHVGLMAIFGLYFLYWVKLNMFETLKYLFFIGVPTFVCGNRLLHSFGVADSQKQKAE